MRMELGLDEDIKNQLRFIEQHLIDQAAKKALADIAKPIRNAVRAQAPDDTGELKKAIGQSAELNRRRHIAVVYVGTEQKKQPRLADDPRAGDGIRQPESGRPAIPGAGRRPEAPRGCDSCLTPFSTIISTS